MNAYPECYLSSAKHHLAQAFDYAVRDCGIDGTKFTSLFAISQLASQFEIGNPWAVAGMSGIEMARTVLEESADPNDVRVMASELPAPTTSNGRSIPYWIGWSIAIYQWSTARSFQTIFDMADYETLADMYEIYHQADISLFIHDMELRFAETKSDGRPARRPR